MFTGIIEEMGEVLSVDHHKDGARLRIRAGTLLDGASIGESIAVSGVCLTMVKVAPGEFEADLAAETLRRTTLWKVQPGDGVNLERPLRLDQRLGGHIVQGHVDGVGTVTGIKHEGDGIWMEIAPPADLARYIAEKGSVAVDGISLTVASAPEGGRFAVALIPHTLSVTTLGRTRVGGHVNLEVDILAKYVERLLEGARGQ
ncbi:MAG: riboflavin synthase subunit alpha [Armatimonadetes bacterium RBG_16_67_12]|nr:MAG: riboflavin synthase subunit alpha [Armatimonadetes bacterium RBG_16_67_12]